MRFDSPHPTLVLPPSKLSLPEFLLDLGAGDAENQDEDFSARLRKPLFLPPTSDSIFAPTRPNVSEFSLQDTRTRALAVARGILDGRLVGKEKPFAKGDVVAVVSANQHDYVANVLGVLIVGGIAALVNPAYKPRELVHALRVTKARAILTSDAHDVSKPATDLDAQISPYETALEANKILLQSGDIVEELPIFLFEENKTNSWSKIHQGFEAKDAEQERVRSSGLLRASGKDAAVCCFSSGTSGLPKAVALSHNNLISNVVQSTFALSDRFNHALVSGKTYNKGKGWYESANHSRAKNRKHDRPVLPNDEIHVDILPQFHCYGFMINLVALHTVTPRVVLPRFHLVTFLKTIQERKVTSSFVVPPVILALAKHPLIDEYDLSSLRVLGSGADNLKAEVAKSLKDRLGVTTSDGYGMTEMSPIVSAQWSVDSDATRGTVGKMCPNTSALVMDPEGNELGPNEAGEILFSGPQMMMGYWNNEEATKNAFYIRPSDGSKWYRTGDVGKLNEQGSIWVTHRVKDVMKVRGFQVSPTELEELLAEDPLVADVAVVGLADEKEETRQIPWAFAVATSPVVVERQASPVQEGGPEEGETDQQQTQTLEQIAAEILKRANEQLVAYKRIKGLTWLEALPKSASGKVLKRELVAMRPPNRMVLTS